jgi:hypothetical protein
VQQDLQRVSSPSGGHVVEKFGESGAGRSRLPEQLAAVGSSSAQFAELQRLKQNPPTEKAPMPPEDENRSPWSRKPVSERAKMWSQIIANDEYKNKIDRI